MLDERELSAENSPTFFGPKLLVIARFVRPGTIICSSDYLSRYRHPLHKKGDGLHAHFNPAHCDSDVQSPQTYAFAIALFASDTMRTAAVLTLLLVLAGACAAARLSGKVYHSRVLVGRLDCASWQRCQQCIRLPPKFAAAHMSHSVAF